MLPFPFGKRNRKWWWRRDREVIEPALPPEPPASTQDAYDAAAYDTATYS